MLCIACSLHKSLSTESQSSDEVNSLHPFKSSMSNNAEKEKRHLLQQLAEERREKHELETELEKMESRVDESSREHERSGFRFFFYFNFWMLVFVWLFIDFFVFAPFFRLNNLVAALRRKLKTELAKAEAAVSQERS